MLERLAEQREAVSLVLSDVTVVKNLNAHQWATVRDLAATLRPFMDVTELMSASSYPTLSMVLPVLDGLQHVLSTSTGGLDCLRAVFTRLLADKFGDVFSDDDLCAATVVDPRFKLSPFDTDDRHQKAMTATIAAMQSVVALQSAPSVATPPPEPVPSTSAQTNATSIWDKLDRQTPTTVTPATRSSASLQHELDLYVADPNIPRSACPLQWWQSHTSTFPVVAEVARRMLSIPATSVASERLFSKAGDVITKKRNQLSPSCADRVLFLMENL